MEHLRQSVLYLSIVLAIFAMLIAVLIGILLYRRCCGRGETYMPRKIDFASWHLSWKDISLFENEENKGIKLGDTYSLCSQVCCEILLRCSKLLSSMIKNIFYITILVVTRGNLHDGSLHCAYFPIYIYTCIYINIYVVFYFCLL